MSLRTGLGKVPGGWETQTLGLGQSELSQTGTAQVFKNWAWKGARRLGDPDTGTGESELSQTGTAQR